MASADLQEWWLKLEPDQRRQLLELHAGDPIPPGLYPQVAPVLEGAQTPTQYGPTLTVPPSLGDFLEEKRAQA